MNIVDKYMNMLCSIKYFTSKKSTSNRTFGNLSVLLNLLYFPIVLLMCSKRKKGMALIKTVIDI